MAAVRLILLALCLAAWPACGVSDGAEELLVSMEAGMSGAAGAAQQQQQLQGEGASGGLSGASGGSSGASGEGGEEDAGALGKIRGQVKRMRALQQDMSKVMLQLRAAKEKQAADTAKLEEGFQDVNTNLGLSWQSSAAAQYQQSLTSLVKMVKRAHVVHDTIEAAHKSYEELQKHVARRDDLAKNVTKLRQEGVKMCHHAVERTALKANIAKRRARLADDEVKRAREVIVSKLALAHEVSRWK